MISSRYRFYWKVFMGANCSSRIGCFRIFLVAKMGQKAAKGAKMGQKKSGLS
ncbi:hypothetical protein GY525_005021 [Escherichia coli]|nr:hypothetical protein [Escherichia coli]